MVSFCTSPIPIPSAGVLFSWTSARTGSAESVPLPNKGGSEQDHGLLQPVAQASNCFCDVHHPPVTGSPTSSPKKNTARSPALSPELPCCPTRKVELLQRRNLRALPKTGSQLLDKLCTNNLSVITPREYRCGQYGTGAVRRGDNNSINGFLFAMHWHNGFNDVRLTRNFPPGFREHLDQHCCCPDAQCSHQPRRDREGPQGEEAVRDRDGQLLLLVPPLSQ